MVPFSFILLFFSMILEGSGTGWTVYPPLSLRDYRNSYSVDFGIFSLHLIGASSIVASVNFLSTVFKIRSKGINLNQMRLFLWAAAVTAGILVLALPVLAGGLTMLLTDRNFNTRFFVTENGGDVIL